MKSNNTWKNWSKQIHMDSAITIVRRNTSILTINVITDKSNQGITTTKTQCTMLRTSPHL